MTRRANFKGWGECEPALITAARGGYMVGPVVAHRRAAAAAQRPGGAACCDARAAGL